MIAHAKLRAKIAEQGLTWQDVALKCDMTPPTLQSRLHGRYEFRTGEIMKIARLLNIPRTKWITYFFE